MKVLVLGGTGVISRSIVSHLLGENYEVTILNRGTTKLDFRGEVEVIARDRRDREAFTSALQKRRFDAVIDMISFTVDDAQQSVEVFGDKTDHLLICSSVAAYKRPYQSVPTKESTESFWDDPTFEYAYNKARMEEYLIAAGSSGTLPITRIRPSLTFGPGARNVGVLRQNYGIVDRITRGKALVMFGDGLTPWSFTFAPDLARGIVGLIGKKVAFGEAFQICNEEPTYWRDLYMEFGALIGREPKLAFIPSEYLFAAQPDLCAHIYREKSFPGLFDNAKLRTVLPGFSAQISLREGLTTLVESWKADGLEVDPEKDALEDGLVAVTERFLADLSGK